MNQYCCHVEKDPASGRVRRFPETKILNISSLLTDRTHSPITNGVAEIRKCEDE
jgi:hypothetical protein